GASDVADRLLAVAETCPLGDLQRLQLTRLRAELAFALRRGSDGPPLLLDAAKRLEPFDVASAREVYAEALAAAIFAGRLNDRARSTCSSTASRCDTPRATRRA